MKKLELNQMEQISGEGFWSGLTCGSLVLSSFATGGASLLIFAGVAAISCGAALGIELE